MPPAAASLPTRVPWFALVVSALLALAPGAALAGESLSEMVRSVLSEPAKPARASKVGKRDRAGRAGKARARARNGTGGRRVGKDKVARKAGKASRGRGKRDRLARRAPRTRFPGLTAAQRGSGAVDHIDAASATGVSVGPRVEAKAW